MRRILLGLLLSLASAAAFAGGTWSNVTVLTLWSYTGQGFGPSGVVQAVVSANGTGVASCASGALATVTVDITTAGGMFAASILQAARLTGSTITIHGTGSCTTVSGTENVSNVVE